MNKSKGQCLFWAYPTNEIPDESRYFAQKLIYQAKTLSPLTILTEKSFENVHLGTL